MKIIFLSILVIIILILIIGNIRIVPQTYAYVIERLGSYQGTWKNGLHVKIPLIDRISTKVNFITILAYTTHRHALEATTIGCIDRLAIVGAFKLSFVAGPDFAFATLPDKLLAITHFPSRHNRVATNIDTCEMLAVIHATHQTGGLTVIRLAAVNIDPLNAATLFIATGIQNAITDAFFTVATYVIDAREIALCGLPAFLHRQLTILLSRKFAVDAMFVYITGCTTQRSLLATFGLQGHARKIPLRIFTAALIRLFTILLSRKRAIDTMLEHMFRSATQCACLVAQPGWVKT